MSDLPTILICDDEPMLREMVGDYLSGRGYRIEQAENPPAMRAKLEESLPDLIILDINMPGEDGLTALRTLRTDLDTPVIMLTAADEIVDRVIGLEMGADDYLGKPVDLRELEARIKAALRRRMQPEDAADKKPQSENSVPFGNCTLDVDAAKLFDAQGSEIYITSMEFNLLRVFSENRGRVLNRDQLLNQAHDKDWDPYDRSIDLRISRLRRKIENNPGKPEVIRTVRGIGYVFG